MPAWRFAADSDAVSKEIMLKVAEEFEQLARRPKTEPPRTRQLPARGRLEGYFRSSCRPDRPTCPRLSNRSLLKPRNLNDVFDILCR
jgi:hypothetical protein